METVGGPGGGFLLNNIEYWIWEQPMMHKNMKKCWGMASMLTGLFFMVTKKVKVGSEMNYDVIGTEMVMFT